MYNWGCCHEALKTSHFNTSLSYTTENVNDSFFLRFLCFESSNFEVLSGLMGVFRSQSVCDIFKCLFGRLFSYFLAGSCRRQHLGKKGSSCRKTSLKGCGGENHEVVPILYVCTRFIIYVLYKCIKDFS